MTEPAEHVGVFRRLRDRFGSRASRRGVERAVRGSEPFEPGRDPDSLAGALAALSRDRGWGEELARSELFVGWSDAVGAAVADHTAPTDLVDGVLVVQCDSTAWATQLGMMRATILQHLAERFPDAGVERLRFLGPDVPSFKRGPRSVPGRGPRDTFG